jgi:hypothetical protein
MMSIAAGPPAPNRVAPVVVAVDDRSSAGWSPAGCGARRNSPLPFRRHETDSDTHAGNPAACTGDRLGHIEVRHGQEARCCRDPSLDDRVCRHSSPRVRGGSLTSDWLTRSQRRSGPSLLYAKQPGCGLDEANGPKVTRRSLLRGGERSPPAAHERAARGT